MIYNSFLKHLEACDGCTGLRDQSKCHFAVVCAHVEGMARRMEIRNSHDLRNRGILLTKFRMREEECIGS